MAGLRDIRLTAKGRLWLGVDGETGKRSAELIGGRQQVAQHLRTRLAMHQGEWFLDKRAGIPYRTEVFVKAPNLTVVNAGFLRIILGVPGVTACPVFEPSYDPRSRRYSLRFIATTPYGDVAASVDCSLDTADLLVLFDPIDGI